MARASATEHADEARPPTALLLPRLSVLAFGEPGSPDLARRIAAALTEPPEPYPGALILERHGAVAVGGPGASGADAGSDPTERAIAGLAQAVDRLELIEVLSRAWPGMNLEPPAQARGVHSPPFNPQHPLPTL